MKRNKNEKIIRDLLFQFYCDTIDSLTPNYSQYLPLDIINDFIDEWIKKNFQK